MDRNTSGAGSADACQSQFDISLAVVIGIGDYGGGIPTLATPVNDAQHLAELLERDHGYQVLLLVADVTRARLETLFSVELPRVMGPDDRLLVYFAGHGIARDGDDGPQGYLVPQDARPDDPASLLPMTDLHAWLSALPCRHMLAVFDCCFAGAFRWSSTRYIGELPDVIHKERFDRFLQSPAWQAITSASYDQRALDVLTGSVAGCLGTRKEDGDRHSPFARAFFAGLAGEGDVVPKGQGDGVITASELALYLRQSVEVEVEQQANLEQTPQIWPLNKHGKGEYIFLVPGHPLNLPPAEVLTEGNNPYRGLRPYERKHRELFFGRESETAELVARLARPEAPPFVAVLGASGTGKSSLVKAGLLPRLEEAGPEWCVLPPMRPTDHPVQVLATLLRQNLPGIPVALDADHGLAQAVAAWKAANPKVRLVLTVDQCEELVTLCHDDAERGHFLDLLARAVRSQPDDFRLVITLRTDFEPQLVQATSLRSGWAAARYVVPPLDQSDLRAVIEGPASVRVLYFEPPGLVDKLINEVVQMPGALPLLSFTLSEMYLRYVRGGRDDRALTQADYEALGGVIGSLRQRATEEYEALPDDAHRATMQRVMLRMISAEGGELARRRVALSELDYPTAEENARVRAVLDRLVGARLLVRGRGQNADGTEGEAYVEPAHDALVLAWDKLLQWKRQAEEYLPLQRRASQAALEWEKANERDKAGLLWDDDPRLPQIERALAPAGREAKPGPLARVRRALWPTATKPRDTAWLNRRELEFTQASVLRRARVHKRNASITAAVIIALAVLAVVALVQAGLARDSAATAITAQAKAETAGTAEAQARQVAETREVEAQTAATAEAQARDLAEQRRAEAEAEARRSRSGELAAQAVSVLEANPELGLLLARQAVETTYQADGTVLPRADAALQQALASPFRQVFQDPRGQASTDATIVAPDQGSFVVEGIKSMLYNRDRRAIGELQGHSPRYSPDSRTIATVENLPGDQQGGLIRLYGAADGALRSGFALALSQIGSPAFSPDGRTLLVAGCTGAGGRCEAGQVQLFAPDGRPLNAISVVASGAPQASFNPADSRQVVVAAGEGAFLWDIETGETRMLVRGTVPVVYTAFSGDGERLVTLTADGVIHLWDRDGNYLKTLTVPGPSPVTVTLNDDGTRILSGAYADTDNVTLQDAAGQVLATKEGMLYDIHPHGTRFATAEGFGSGEVSVWDEAGNPVARFTAHGSQVTSLDYSSDGGYLVTTGCDTAVTMGEVCRAPSTRVWAFDDRLTADVANQGEGIVALHAAPDGAHLLALECDISFETLGSPQNCLSSETRQRLGVIWDVAAGRAVPLGPPGAYAAAARMTPDGVILLQCEPGADLNTCDNPQLIAYDLAGQPTGQVADPHLAAVRTADISPDGRRLLLLGASPAPESKLFDEELPAPLYVWNTRSDDWIPAGSLRDHFTWAALSPDEEHFAALDPDRAELTLWSLDGHVVATATLETDTPMENVRSQFSPDGQRIALSACAAGHMGQCDDDTLFLWSLGSEQVRSLAAGAGLISSLVFSPDGRWMVIVNPRDELVQLWDISGGGAEKLRATLRGFSSEPMWAAFRPQGDRLLTAHEDGSVWLWDLDGNSLGAIKAFTGRSRLAVFSGDGNQVVAVGCDAVSVTDDCEPEMIRSWHVWQDTDQMLAEAGSRLGGRDLTPEECQSYLGLEGCP